MTTVGIDPENIIFLTIVIQVFALVSLYHMASRISSKSYAGFIAGLIYILWYEFQQWNLIVYTDAMFAHLVVICLYLAAGGVGGPISLYYSPFCSGPMGSGCYWPSSRGEFMGY